MAAAVLAAAAPTTAAPNVVVIETDDQTVADLDAMPRTRALIAAAGTTFRNSHVSLSQCCPSRATLLTGRYAHNHGVLASSPPYGGIERLAAAQPRPRAAAAAAPAPPAARAAGRLPRRRLPVLE